MGDPNDYIAKVTSRINAIIDPLESTLKESEPFFVNVGQELQTVYSDATELSQLTTEMAELIGGKSNNGFLRNIGDLSRDSLDELESSGSSVTTSIQEVETNLGNLQLLYSKAPALKNISKSLNIVILSMAIESRRTEECEKVFEYFVADIKDLVSKVIWIANNMFDESKSASSDQASALEGLSVRRNQLRAIADSARTMVTESLTKIERVIKISLEAINEVADHSNAISKQVGEAVFAIQFDDIARQQVEHIIEAFHDTKETIGKSDGSLGMEGEKNTLSKARSILNLQAAQLKQVISEIENAHAKIDKAFKEIGTEVEMLMSRVSNLGLTSAMEGSREAGPLADLITGLESLNSIMEEGNTLSKQIEQTMMQSAKEASMLSEYLSQIENISLDLHIKAINAVIMSKKLGKDGIALSVLAQEVSEISQESDKFASDVMGILKSISDLSQTIIDASSTKISTHKMERERCNKALEDRVLQTSNTYDTILENSAIAAKKARVLQDKIMSIESNLNFLNKLKGKFNKNLEKINDAVQYLDPFTVGENEMELGHLSERYTMERERDIHGAATASMFSSSENRKEEKPESSLDADLLNNEDDEFGDNVELF